MGATSPVNSLGWGLQFSVNGRAIARIIVRAVVSPSADILNRTTIDCEHPIPVIPDLKVDVHNSLTAFTKLGAKILAGLNIKAVRILDKAEASVFVGLCIETGVVLILSALPSHPLRYIPMSVARHHNDEQEA